MEASKKLIKDFHASNKIRVWSLVITIFGDCINLRGGTIAMAELQNLTNLLRIEPGTLRTAMSRLAKERWLTREKVGRNSYYKISKKGLRSFSEPTIRIYAKNRISEPKNFFIGIRELGPGANKPGYEEFLARTNSIALSKQVFLTSSEASLDNYLKDENIFLLQASKHNMPYWVKSLIYPSIIKRNLLEFMNKFHSLDLELTNKPCSAKEALIIRILLVHEWRRIILKIPPNPSNFEDDDWPLENCRSLVASIYSKVSLKSEDWWEIPLNEKQELELKKRFK